MTLEFYSSIARGSKLIIKTFGGLIPTFEEIAGKNLVGEFFGSPILKN